MVRVVLVLASAVAPVAGGACGGGDDACADPAGAWTPITTLGAPPERDDNTAVWTGEEMIVWGGVGDDSDSPDEGGRYRPADDTWAPVAPSPAMRSGHSALWTGEEMIVWGGYTADGLSLTGAAYDPASDSWRDLSGEGAPPGRFLHAALWTGDRMIVWGGASEEGGFLHFLSDGGVYRPADDAWVPMSDVNAPTSLQTAHAVWTGDEMLVWGFEPDDAGGAVPAGYRYRPATDSWTTMSTDLAVSSASNALWTGDEMLLTGGGGIDGRTIGGLYDPARDTWRVIATSCNPPGNLAGAAVWTGAAAIYWGGLELEVTVPLSTGALYRPADETWTATSNAGAPSARDRPLAVWTGDEMLVWDGRDRDVSPIATGARFRP